MDTLPVKSYKKATQALNFFAEKKDGRINKMKAIKLIFLADKLHLRKYGRPIIGDSYLAMRYGPVGSQAKNVAELSFRLPTEIATYAKKYIKPTIDKNTFNSISPVDLDLFSKTDVECLNSVYDEFSDKDQFELAEITHKYPEWLKHKKVLDSGKKKSVKMDYEDFFLDSSNEKIFSQDKKVLSLSKELFEEEKEISSFFSK